MNYLYAENRFKKLFFGKVRLYLLLKRNHEEDIYVLDKFLEHSKLA